jgi:hypothetical protein
MARTVIILGAGASRIAGGPLMSDFIANADMIRRTNEAKWAQDSFDRVFAARAKLQRAAAKANLDIDNIEHLFSAFEMGRLLGRLADIAPPDLDRLVDATKRLITRTLEFTIKWATPNEELVLPPEPYEAFVELVSQIHNSQLYGPVALITFNYDLAIDYALSYRDLKTDYCLSDAPIRADHLPLMKLHGSLNWFDSEKSEITFAPLRPLPKAILKPWGGNELATIDTATLLQDSSLWINDSPPTPVIVPPTWSKGEYHRKLLNVWRHAANQIAEAENFIVIGYSLPPTDQFFRDFYGLSTISDIVMNRFWIVNPESCQQRFAGILGEPVRNRGCLVSIQKEFHTCITELAYKFGFKFDRLQKLHERDASIRGGNKKNAQELSHWLWMNKNN